MYTDAHKYSFKIPGKNPLFSFLPTILFGVCEDVNLSSLVRTFNVDRNDLNVIYKNKIGGILY